MRPVLSRDAPSIKGVGHNPGNRGKEDRESQQKGEGKNNQRHSAEVNASHAVRKTERGRRCPSRGGQDRQRVRTLGRGEHGP